MRKLILLLLPLFLCCHHTLLEPLDSGEMYLMFQLPPNTHLTGVVKDRVNTPVKHFDEGFQSNLFEIEWDYTDDDGEPIYEGIYVITFYTDGQLFHEDTFTLFNQ